MRDHVSVCICTLHRTVLLERLLRRLAVQETANLFDFSVVVVDNDKGGSAESTILRCKAELGLDIVYEVEPHQIIPAARNHALRLARGNHVAIIDDDEFPPPNWLIDMYRAIQTFEVDGVLGPARPVFEQQPPAWLLKTNLHERPEYRTGTLLQWHQCYTSNVLVRKSVFHAHGLSFDETFKTGGSDQEFFRQAMMRGCRFIAVEEAPVYEIMPLARCTKSYFLRRALVNGYNAHKYWLNERRGLKWVSVPLKSIVALIVYALIMPFCVCLGTHVFMRYAERGCHHLSRLLALLRIEAWKRRDF